MFFNVWKCNEAQISKKLSYLLNVFRKAYFEVGFIKNFSVFELQIVKHYAYKNHVFALHVSHPRI